MCIYTCIAITWWLMCLLDCILEIIHTHMYLWMCVYVHRYQSPNKHFNHPVAEFFQATHILEILEAFEMQCQNIWRALHPYCLVCFLCTNASCLTWIWVMSHMCILVTGWLLWPSPLLPCVIAVTFTLIAVCAFCTARKPCWNSEGVEPVS